MATALKKLVKDTRPRGGDGGSITVNFPILEHLTVSNYGLYPGIRGAGLSVDFRGGLTLVVGANGLGKTTLVSILYRMLAGTHDISGLTDKVELGNIDPTAKPLRPNLRATFARRVRDGARTATAELRVRIGSSQVRIGRQLDSLSLTEFSVDGKALPPDETLFQARITALAAIGSFGDWILLLRFLVLYLEDRRALVWDTQAQKQILRLLFLSPNSARSWTRDEREILELDSRQRNMLAILNKQEAQVAKSKQPKGKPAALKKKLSVLERRQELDRKRLVELDASVLDLASQREHARLRYLRAEQERDAHFRNVEHAKLASISARFPTKSATARFVLSQILADAHCLVCGTDVPNFAAELERRVSDSRCVVCSSQVEEETGVVSSGTVATRRVGSALSSLQLADLEKSEAALALEKAEKIYDETERRLAEKSIEVAEREAELSQLSSRLPPEEGQARRERSQLAGMRAQVSKLKADLLLKRKAFGAMVDGVNTLMSTKANAIRKAFEKYASAFLFEKCRLSWAPHSARVGQTGELIQFPAFQLEMSGTDFNGMVRREEPDQVSESQREFIDLSFRMALISVAGSQGVGSMIIDAPEASLDAVFTTRAAEVLASFADPRGESRLVVTSNLVDGALIPTLVKLCTTPEDRADRIVNLFKIAEPTAAVREHKQQYEQILADALGISA